VLVLCLTRVPPVPCRNLHSNQLSGTIPTSLGSAISLNKLYVIGVLDGDGCMGEYVHVCMSVWAMGVRVRVHVCMEVRLYGCMGARADGCMDVWVYGVMSTWVYGHSCMDVRMDGCTCVWMHGCTDVCMHGCTGA
jgi:hypothetical protein